MNHVRTPSTGCHLSIGLEVASDDIKILKEIFLSTRVSAHCLQKDAYEQKCSALSHGAYIWGNVLIDPILSSQVHCPSKRLCE